MEGNPYQSPSAGPERPPRDLWRLILFGPSDPWVVMIPLTAFAIIAVIFVAAVVIKWPG